MHQLSTSAAQQIPWLQSRLTMIDDLDVGNAVLTADKFCSLGIMQDTHKGCDCATTANVKTV